MKLKHYKLNKDYEPVECSLEEAWNIENTINRIIARTPINDEIKVSTVFLTIDHGFYMYQGPPILFETMIFGGEHDQFQERYCTYKEACIGHIEAVKMVLKSLESNELKPGDNEITG